VYIIILLKKKTIVAKFHKCRKMGPPNSRAAGRVMKE
jgi:hypothetical protein